MAAAVGPWAGQPWSWRVAERAGGRHPRPAAVPGTRRITSILKII